MQRRFSDLLINIFPPAFACILAAQAYGSAPKVAPTETFVQAAAFSQEQNAQSFKNVLAKNVKSNVSVKKTSKWHKVIVGPLKQAENREGIENTIHQLLAKQNNDTPTPILKSKLPSIALPKEQKATPKRLVKESSSQKTAPITGTKQREELRLWNLRQADVKSVIAEVSRITGKNFVIDPRVQGKISIISKTPISNKELYAVFLSMLQVSGFSAVDAGDVTKIVPNIEAKSLAGIGGIDGLKKKDGDEMVVQVVPVLHVSSEQLVPVLRPLMPQWSNVSAYGPSNMLILAGRAANIRRLADIITQVDSASAHGIDVVSLEYALAMDVVATIKSLLDSQKSGLNPRQATIAADDKANAVLISGSKTDRLKLRILISQLDSKEQGARNENTQVIYLHFSRAQDLAPILAGIAQANFSGEVGTTIGALTTPTLDTSNPAGYGSGSSGGSSDGTTSSDANSGNNSYGGTSNNSPASLSSNTQASTTSSEGSAKPKVQIIAEPNTNSIIVSGPATVTRILRNVISKLDIRPAQVLIEALIAEINEDDVNQLGLDWGTVVTDGEGNSAFRRGFAVLDSTTNLSDFQAQLYALINNKKANILSTPSIVVLDNRQAKILVGQQVSVQDSTYPNNAGGSTTASPYTTFTRQDVALHLYVRPQISLASSIQLQIDQGNDTLANPLSVIDAKPVINTSSINTSVLVNSGDILVLGGLTQNGLQTQDYAIPILSSIPGVGRAFQNNSTTHNKKVLMVFIRPIILNNVSAGLKVTGSKYDDIQKQQLNMLEKQPYDTDNKTLVLKDLDNTELPTPFSKNKAYVK